MRDPRLYDWHGDSARSEVTRLIDADLIRVMGFPCLSKRCGRNLCGTLSLHRPLAALINKPMRAKYTFSGGYAKIPKYVVSPPISVRRIGRYDGARVTYHYRSHRTERLEHETVTVETLIGRMVEHTVPKGFKRIRYYGVQTTKTFAKVKVMIQAPLAKVEGVVKGAVQIIAR